jgi:hypothetical protein
MQIIKKSLYIPIKMLKGVWWPNGSFFNFAPKVLGSGPDKRLGYFPGPERCP